MVHQSDVLGKNELMPTLKIVLYFSVLFMFTQSFAQSDPRLSGIVVVSDFHLFDPDFDASTAATEFERNLPEKNEKAYRRMMKAIKNQAAVSDVVMNGDIFHAPSMKNISPDLRVERMVQKLMEMGRELNKTIHFNFGNHDVLMEMVDGKLTPVPGFAQKFEKALEIALETEFQVTGARPRINLIGKGSESLGDYRAVYEINIAGKDIHISHAPFVSTDAIEKQAELFKDMNPRAYDKVTLPTRIFENPTNIIYIQSDSHTPGFDRNLHVYNTGMLTEDIYVPFKESTFLVIGKDGAEHFSFERDLSKPIFKFEYPNCGILFSK